MTASMQMRGSSPRFKAPLRIRLWMVQLAMVVAWISVTLIPAGAAPHTNAVLLDIAGKVLISRAGSAAWDPAHTNQLLLPRDRVQTYESSRALLRLSDLSHVRLGPNSIAQIPDDRTRYDSFQLLRGLLYYFHRDKPGTLPVRTPSAYAVILGTEFAVTVGPDNATRIDLLQGEVELTNEFGSLRLTSGEAALAEPGRRPVKTPALQAVNAVQWVLHYPAVLDPVELRFTADEAQALSSVLAAYRQGDLLQALAAWPMVPPGSPEARVFHAALLLAVGDVPEAEVLLQPQANASPTDSTQLPARALQTLIAAVRYQPATPRRPNDSSSSAPSLLGDPGAAEFPRTSATALLAESYYQQSRHHLDAARQLARAATECSPEFGFAWARLAELEFSFGERHEAGRALERALALSPRHAQAHALRGFVRAAGNRIADARLAFDQAIALDGALGLAWLGRGLCRIRHGDLAGGREDLQSAATLEPQRALFRSYLAKAYGQEGDAARARHELDVARDLDPGDPTAWFYSALTFREQNRINPAIRDLAHATDLNDGRQVYRSQQLLDQDAAVQGTHLAGLYADAGMTDWSASQAGRAVQLDPANYAGHLFLGDSYQSQRDPGRVSQRYETAIISEYLLANLLAPVGAGTLAQSITANEYSKLFESDGPGFASATEYLSRGAWTESAAHYGTMGRSSFALSGFYRSDPGQRANHDSEEYEVTAQLKQQLTAADSVYLHVIRGAIEGGDLTMRQDPAAANPSLRFREEIEPLMLAGYHREWGPGLHTLALAGWISDVQHVSNDRQGTLLLDKTTDGTNVDYAVPALADQRYRAQAGLFTAELQQLWRQGRHAGIVGGRFQAGTFEVANDANDLALPTIPATIFQASSQHMESDLRRASGYGYYQFEATPELLLVAGLSYDWLSYPVNFRYAPLVHGEEDVDQLSPKGGLIWRPSGRSALRAGYSQSLGGVGFDQSFRLEPTQVAGFNQAYRSLIPESIGGPNTAASFETVGVAAEHRLGRGTFMSLSGEWLRSGVDRTIGVYDYTGTINPSSTRERLAFDERTLVFSVNQLVGDDWAFGLRYRASQAELREHLLELPSPPLVAGSVPARSRTEGLLHQIQLLTTVHLQSGFFGVADAVWNRQVNEGAAGIPDEDFWMCNLQAGWRGWRRRVEIRVGLLNIFDQDYRLHPINLTPELPRERTFMASCLFQF